DLLRRIGELPVAGAFGQALQAVGALPLDQPVHVAHEVIGGDADGRAVVPTIGKADVARDLVELGERLLAGRFVHPVEIPNAIAVGGAQVIDHFRDLGAIGGAEILGDVDLA